jgi:hypothetical protein
MAQQQAVSALTPATLLAVNVNGLSGDAKRRAFLQFAATAAWDVLVLTETHCEGAEVATRWLREGAGPGKPWLGHAFWSHGGTASRGVAVLLRHGFAPKAKIEYADQHGRLLRVGWERGAGQRPVSVLAVYAPSDGSASREAFFAPGGPLNTALQSGAGTAADILMGGDFNCSLPAPAPGVGALEQPALRGDAQRLQSLLAAAGLADVWAAVRAAPSTGQRQQAGDAATFISHGTGGARASRLDYWFAPHALVAAGWAAKCAHRWDAAAPSDHAAVYMEWRCPVATPKGVGRWRFPSSLLHEPAFVTGTAAALQQFIQQWQPCSPAEQAAPARSRWEAVKALLKERAVERMQRRAAERAAARWQATAAERRARADLLRALPGASQAAYRRWRQAAERLATVGAAGQGAAAPGAAQLPLDVLWEAYGEQSSRYFFQLMPREPAAAAVAGGITAVRTLGPDGQPAVRSVHQPGGVAAVGEALSAFFDGRRGGLFAPGQVSVADQDLLLGALDRQVPAAEAQLCKGPGADGSITAACLHRALGGTANGKAPGSDGLTYEAYKAFWGALAQPLADCFNEAFADASAEPLLTPSQRQGVITLLHKGGDKPVDDVASYRPITLLNSDVKLLARVLVSRITPGLECVVDRTQTGFLPGRWVGDNVLYHLEEFDYCQAEGVPGCVLFLDFEKAYDRLDRGWLYRCVERLGFPAEVGRWVRLLLSGTEASVSYHGFQSPWVAVLSGVAQGSPASPGLYLIAAQPLAARLRQVQAAGVVDAVVLPSSKLAPPSHQHADDTTLHTRTPSGAKAALDMAVAPFGRATNARLNASKSHGVLLGPGHDCAAGRLLAEVETGVPFVAPAAHIRHLGVLLSASDPAGACRAMFQKRRAGVQLRIRSWARFELSYLGRLLVAKQVLASSLYYHATFDCPPPEVLQQIVECVDSFVEFGRWIEPGEAGLVRRVPSAAVESLDYGLGGLRRPDIPAQVMALHAKVAAMLLHPCRHAWKGLMQRAFQREVPELGPAALVSTRLPVACPGRSPRRLAYWRALHALAPNRLVAPGELTPRHVLVERLVHNAQVVGARATEPVLTALPHALRRSPSFQPSLAGVRAVLREGAGAAGSAQSRSYAAAQQLASRVAPAGWRQVLSAGELPPPLWQVSGCGSWLRWCGPPERHAGGAVLFAVRADGRVAAAGAVPPPQLAAAAGGGALWLPACVVWCPVQKGQTLLVRLQPDPHLAGADAFKVAEGEECSLQAWVLGEWGVDVWVDPCVWGFGGTPLTAFKVRSAADRLKLLGMCRAKPAFNPADGVRPAVFGVPGLAGSGLAVVEQRQVGLFAERWRALVARQPGQGRRVRPRLPEDERGLCPLYDAGWMRPSASRAHPLERTLARQGAAQTAAGGQARRDDCRDVLAGYVADRRREWPDATRRPPWKQAFGDLRRLKRLDRRLRLFGWLLTHGALRCGGVMVQWWAGRQGADEPAAEEFVEQCGCGAEACVHGERPPAEPPPCETLSHVFLHCPVVQPAAQWLRRLCQQALGQAPPLDAAVIVVGDGSKWAPAAGAADAAGADGDAGDLWTHLRLQYLKTVWSLTARRARTGQQFDAAAVVAATAAALERAIWRDWERVWAAPEGADSLPSWCRLGLRQVVLDRSAFERRWLAGGVLAHLEGASGRGVLRVHVPRALVGPAAGAP